MTTTEDDTGLEPLEGNYFVSTYPPFSCWDAAGAEQYAAVLRRRAEGSAPPLGIYVHVPFCVERCQYCYYLSYDDRAEEIGVYLTALLREAELLGRSEVVVGRRPAFVYFGGGTPSVLSARRLAALLDGLRRAMPWEDAREICFECAPRSVTEPKLRILRDAGVTRISMGVQAFDDDVLRRNGRVHLVSDALRAFSAVRRADFEWVNLDLIVGLVGETDESFARTVERVIDLEPESITIYQLEIPLNTPLYRDLAAGRLDTPPASWPVKRRRLDRAFSRLEQAGWTLRSAYAAVRDPARHTFVYQDAQYHGADLLGLGTSAFSHVAGVNQQNLASVSRYVEALDRGELPLWRGYAMSDEERMVRELVLQLKLGRVESAYFREKFGVELTRRFAEPLARFAAQGLLRLDESGVGLTRRGLLRVDRMVRGFYLPRHRGLRYS